MENLDEDFLTRLSEETDLTETGGASARLKARVYSALVERQSETGPLLSLTATHAQGQELCVFEHLVRITPVGERVKALNICRVCHARVLAEHIENAPIYWSGCPYVGLKNS